MKIFFRHFCLISLLPFLLTACSNIPCDNPGMYLEFKGFDSYDLSRVTLRKYAQNSDLTSLLSISIADTTYAHPVTADTSYRSFDQLRFDISTGYDWVIDVPGANRTYKITGISIAKKSQKHSSLYGGEVKHCTNDLSYYLNGVYKHSYGATSSDYVSGAQVDLVK